MPRVFAVLSLVLLLQVAACGGAPANDEGAAQRSLIGTWQAQQGDSSFDFLEDGKVVFVQNGIPAKGTYALVAGGDSVRIELATKAPFALHLTEEAIHLPGPPGRMVNYERVD